MATFNGTDSSETITPGAVSGSVSADPPGSRPSVAADTIYGMGGNDTIDGGGGADNVYGGDGNDSIRVTTEFSTVSGDAGYDRVYLSGTTGNTINLATAGIE